MYVQQGVMSRLVRSSCSLPKSTSRMAVSPKLSICSEAAHRRARQFAHSVRLADLYQAMGQSKEAMETYVSAAQRALARGDQTECEKLAEQGAENRSAKPRRGHRKSAFLFSLFAALFQVGTMPREVRRLGTLRERNKNALLR